MICFFFRKLWSIIWSWNDTVDACLLSCELVCLVWLVHYFFRLKSPIARQFAMMALSVTNSNVVSVILEDSTDEQETARTCNDSWIAGFIGGLNGRAATDTNMQRRLDRWISSRTRRTSSKRHEHATPLGPLDFVEDSTDEQQTTRTCNDSGFLG